MNETAYETMNERVTNCVQQNRTGT
jgi:hypothetical protein